MEGGDAVNSCKDVMSQHYVSYNVQVEATTLVHRCTERPTMYMTKYEVIHFNNHKRMILSAQYLTGPFNRAQRVITEAKTADEILH